MNKKLLKKSLAVISGTMLGAFVACSESSDSSSVSPDADNESEEVSSSSSSAKSSSSQKAKSSSSQKGKSSSSQKVESSSSQKGKSSSSGKVTSSSSSSASSAKATYLDDPVSPEDMSSSSAKENVESSSSEDASSSSSENISSSSAEKASSSSEKVCVPQEYKVGEFQTWVGDECNSRVNTGLDNGSKTSGYWFTFNDDSDGGKSKVEWPVELGSEISDDAMDPVVAFCGGVCGTAVLEKGSLTYQPFMGVGFNVAGEEVGGGEPEPADASEWGGLCVSYKMENIDAAIELGLGDIDATIGYANPRVNLKKSADTTVAIKWSDFKHPIWYKGATRIEGEEAAKQLVAVKFKMQGAPDKYKFNIMSVGPLNGDCQSTDK